MLLNLRIKAKHHLRGNWSIAILGSVIVLSLQGVPSQISLLLPNITIGVMLVFQIVSIAMMPVEVGLNGIFLDLAKEQGTAVDRVFYAFQYGRYLRSLGALLLRSLWIILGVILFIIPAIIWTFAYALVPLLLADDRFNNLSASEILNISKRYMSGYKTKLFLIQLYYTWWYGILYGIGGAMVNFESYKDLGYGIIALALIVFTFYTTPKLRQVIAEFYLEIVNKDFKHDSNNTVSEDILEDTQKPDVVDPLALDEDDDPFFS
jgi:uncharacterized membrane protein